jgi:hypothetical protein
MAGDDAHSRNGLFVCVHSSHSSPRLQRAFHWWFWMVRVDDGLGVVGATTGSAALRSRW